MRGPAIRVRDKVGLGPTAARAGDQAVIVWLRALLAGGPARLGEIDDAVALSLLRWRLQALAAARGARHRFLANAERQAFTQNALVTQASSAALELLREADVESLTLKGPALAAQLWGDPVLRLSADVDLLVRRDDVAPARRALAGGGLVPEANYPWWFERRWRFHAGFGPGGAVPVPLELHWNVVRAGIGTMDAGEVLDDLVEVDVAGVPLPAPPLRWQLPLAAGHAVNHRFDLRSLLDLALLDRSADGDDWAFAVEAASRWRLAPALWTAATLSGRLLGWTPPVAVQTLRPGRLRRRALEVALRDAGAVPDASWRALQSEKILSPLAASSGARWLAAAAWGLGDRPNVAAALERGRARLRRPA